MKNKNKPPKFVPTKDDMTQMELMYRNFMQIARGNGITEQTMENIVVGLVRKVFRERHAKNWYKTKFNELNGKD